MANDNNSAGEPALRTGYIPELDTLRLLAILSVMCLHWLPEHGLFNRIQSQTSNGVHLFFVLSGYLITGILLRCRWNVDNGLATRAYSFRQFYARRFLRIFPVYYLALAIGVVFHFEAVRRALPWHVTYTSNFYYYFHRRFDGPASLFWTLSVEEQFYLLWPLVILTLPRQWIFRFVAAVALLTTGCRIQALLQDSWLKILTPWCMNFLAIGSLLAVAESSLCGSVEMRRHLLRRFGIVAVIFGLLLAAVACRLSPHQLMTSPVVRAIDQIILSVLYACLLAWVSGGTAGQIKKILRWRPFVYLGRISYGLYVYHLFVSFGLRRGEPWLVAHLGHRAGVELADGFVFRFAITAAVASLSWFILEKPLNDLKRFFPYKPTDQPQLCETH